MTPLLLCVLALLIQASGTAHKLKQSTSLNSQSSLKQTQRKNVSQKAILNLLEVKNQGSEGGLLENREEYYKNLCQDTYQQPVDVFASAARQLNSCVLAAGAAKGTTTTLKLFRPYSQGEFQINLVGTVGNRRSLVNLDFSVTGNATVRQNNHGVVVAFSSHSIGHIILKNSDTLEPSVYHWQFTNVAEDASVGRLMLDVSWQKGRVLNPSCGPTRLPRFRLEANSASILFPCQPIQKGYVSTLRLRTLSSNKIADRGILVSMLNEKNKVILMNYNMAKSKQNNTTVGVASTLGFIQVDLSKNTLSRYDEVVIRTPPLHTSLYRWRLLLSASHPEEFEVTVEWTNPALTLLPRLSPALSLVAIPRGIVQTDLRFHIRLDQLQTASSRRRFETSIVGGMSASAFQKRSRFTVVALLPAVQATTGIQDDKGGTIAVVNILPGDRDTPSPNDVESTIKKSLKKGQGPIFEHSAFKSLNMDYYREGDPSDVDNRHDTMVAVVAVVSVILLVALVTVCVYYCLRNKIADDEKIDDWDFYATPESYDTSSISAPISNSVATPTPRHYIIHQQADQQ